MIEIVQSRLELLQDSLLLFQQDADILILQHAERDTTAAALDEAMPISGILASMVFNSNCPAPQCGHFEFAIISSH